MKMSRILIILCLLTISCLESQESIKSEVAKKVISVIIESRASQIGYYFNEKPTYDQNLKLDTIYTLINTETGEYYSDSGFKIDSVRRSVYEVEIPKWEKKEKLNKRVFLIKPFIDNSYYKVEYLNDLCDSSWIVDILAKGKQSNDIHVDMMALNNTDTLLFDHYSDKNREFYKYSLCGYIELSDVYLSPDKSKAVVFVGFLFSYFGGQGHSGFGAVVLLERQNRNWKIKKGNTLWEV